MLWYEKNALDSFYPVGNLFGGFHMIFLKDTRRLKQFLQLQPFEWNVWFFLNNHDHEK